MNQLVVYPPQPVPHCRYASFLETYGMAEARIMPKRYPNGSFQFVVPTLEHDVDEGNDPELPLAGGVIQDRKLILRSASGIAMEGVGR